VFLLTLAAPLSAAARELDYRAPDACPPRDAVLSRVDAAAPDAPPARIAIVRDDLLYRGEVVTGDVSRTVTASTCEAVVSSLVLVVAMDQDRPEENDGAAATPRLGWIDPRDRASDEPAPTWRPAEIALGATGSETTWRDAFMPSAAVFGELAMRRAAYQPSARLTIGRVFPTEVQPGGLSLAMTTASVDACPLAFGGDLSRTSLCGRIDVGILDAKAGDASQSARWLAAGGLVRERLAFGKPGTPRPFAEIAGGLLAPLTKHRFVSDDDTPMTQFTLAIAGGVLLP
jgi:hypothetical protein